MAFGKSGLQVHDLNELETMGVLDAAIESASMRRNTSLATVTQTEAEGVHGGISLKALIAGYFPVYNLNGLDQFNPSIDVQQSF